SGLNVPAVLTMTSEHELRNQQLRRLGVLFSSSSSQGDAELVLKDSNRGVFSFRFSLVSAVPNRYRYFQFPPGIYRSAEIHADRRGVRVWEAYRQGRGTTCLVYEYVDGAQA